MTSPTPTAHRQFTLYRESYLRFDGKKHVLTGREHRKNWKQRHLYKHVSFRLVFHPCATPTAEQMTELKVRFDNLRLKGIVTRIEGTSLVILTSVRCSSGKRTVKKVKIWLCNQVAPLVNPESDPSDTPIKGAGRRAIRHGRQHNPRQLITQSVTIAPEPPAVPDVSALAHNLAERTVASCARHQDLDNLEAELALGLLVVAAV